MGSKTFKVRGSSSFLKNDEVSKLKRVLEKKAPIEEYDGREDDREIKTALFDASFFTDKKAVFVRNADKMNQATAERFVDEPVEGRVAVFIQSDQSRVKKWFRELNADKCIEVKKPKRWKVPEWIRSRARKMGMSMGKEAAELIQDHCGNELYVLNNELRKLALHTGGGAVGEEDLEGVLVRHDDVGIFSICEKWGRGENELAVDRFGDFRRMGGSAVGFVHVMMGHVEKMLLARSLWDKGDRSGSKTMSELGIPKFIWDNKVKPQVRSRQQPAWADAFEQILDVDFRVKSGEAPWPLIELFLIDF